MKTAIFKDIHYKNPGDWVKWPIKIQTKRQPKVFHRILIGQDVEYLRCMLKSQLRKTYPIPNMIGIAVFDYSLFYGHTYGNARLLGMVCT